MGASLALGGLGACTRQPTEFIVPYVTQPEQLFEDDGRGPEVPVLQRRLSLGPQPRPPCRHVRGRARPHRLRLPLQARQLVSRVETSVNRRPQDARIDYHASGLTTVPSKSGLAVRAQALEDQIDAAVSRPQAARRFVAHTRKIPAKVTRSQLAKKYPAIIIVDRSAFTLRLYRHLKLEKTYAVGFWRKTQKCALRPLSFEVEEGEVFGYLGPNGAGKTTLIRMLLGLTSVTSGRVRILGHERRISIPCNPRLFHLEVQVRVHHP